MSSVVTATGTRTDSLKLKVDINFMKFVKTEDEWERDVMTAGDKLLCIVDCYSQLWGPCEMLSGHFSNCFFDYGEDLGMRFVRAQSDQIAALSDYREQAQPVFLFYLNGELIEKIEGTSLPKILATIMGKAPKLKETPNW